MASFEDLKSAVETAAAARVVLEAAQTALFAKNAEVLTLIPDEIAAQEAATAVMDVAFAAARVTVGWSVANDAFQQASADASIAEQAVLDAVTSYQP